MIKKILINNNMFKISNLSVLVIFLLIIVFIVPRYTDSLPYPLIHLFINPYFRALIVFLAIYTVQYNLTFSILVTLVFLIILNQVQNRFLFELFLENYQNNIDNFRDLAQEEDDVPKSLKDYAEDKKDKDKYINNSQFVEKCLATIKQKFPCNRKNINGCCPSPNLDIMARDELGKTKNITVFMNKLVEKAEEEHSMNPIETAKKWCSDYLEENSDGLGNDCKNDRVIGHCKKIIGDCEIKRWSKPKKKKYPELSGTCAIIDDNIEKQVCFDIDPKKNKCRNLNLAECKQNKKDCFYLNNHQFINSKVKKYDKMYKCNIPKSDDDLPKNCFPVKLYKDNCGNVGMGCWVKAEDIDYDDDEPDKEPPKILSYKSGDDVPEKNPTVNYRTGNHIGFINNSGTCH